MKKNPFMFSAALAAVSIMSSATAFCGQEGHGGDRIGQYLRDLVDKGACTVQTAKTFEKANSLHVDEILSKLSQTHWIFALQLRQEIGKLRICEVKAQLKRIQTTDLDEYTYYSVDDVHPVGIRSGDTVYVEGPSFEALNSFPALLSHPRSDVCFYR